MKRIVFFLLAIIVCGLTMAQSTTGQGQKQEATFVKEGKSADKFQDRGEEKSIKSFKIRQDGTIKVRKSKVREMMGSARSSGPAQKIEKRTVTQKVSRADLRQILTEPDKAKKRSEK